MIIIILKITIIVVKHNNEQIKIKINKDIYIIIYIIYLLAVHIYYIDILEITWWYLALSGNGGTPSCGLFIRGGQKHKPVDGLG